MQVNVYVMNALSDKNSNDQKQYYFDLTPGSLNIGNIIGFELVGVPPPPPHEKSIKFPGTAAKSCPTATGSSSTAPVLEDSTPGSVIVHSASIH